MTWKRQLGWIGIFLIVLIVVFGIAGYFAFRSEAFNQYVLAKIQQQASEATGAQVRIQNFALHLSTLSADAYGITIHGSEPESRPPLVQADQLMIRLKIISLLHKKVDLNEIVLRHPVVNFQVKKDGGTNLPTPPKSNSNSSTNLFDLGIQHVLLSHGEIYYNDVKTPLDAELHELQLEVKAEFASKGYEGSLSYRGGRLQYGDMKPLPHDLKARFNATPSEFTLNPLVLTVASSTIELGRQCTKLLPSYSKRQLQNHDSPTGLPFCSQESLYSNWRSHAGWLAALSVPGQCPHAAHSGSGWTTERPRIGSQLTGFSWHYPQCPRTVQTGQRKPGCPWTCGGPARWPSDCRRNDAASGYQPCIQTSRVAAGNFTGRRKDSSKNGKFPADPNHRAHLWNR